MERVDVGTSIGYSLKRVTSALRASMDAALHDLDLGVSQYSTLELLAQRPDISNAELARATFVTRQATHQLLAGLRARGLVASTEVGREHRNQLTPAGARLLARASRAVAHVEEQMLSDLAAGERDVLRDALARCARALAPAG